MSEADSQDTESIGDCDTAPPQPTQDYHEEDYTFPEGKVVKAIRHEFIRAELLQRAEAAYTWTHPQPKGAGPDNRTAPCSFPPDQLDWGWTRQFYPKINFVLEKKGYKHPPYDVAHWYHNGRLVLDLSGKPMRKFHHLPDTCSSKLHGGHIEALMRFDDRTFYTDIRGRMPPRVTYKKKGEIYTKQIKGTNALSAAAKVYREKAGCISWCERAGSDLFKNWILANLPTHLRARNTTQGWRDLTKAEIATIKEPTIGSRPNQARNRSNSEEARQKREENIKKRRTQAARHKASAKEARQDEVQEEYESNSDFDEDDESSEDDIEAGETFEDEETDDEAVTPAGPNYATLDPTDARFIVPTTREELTAICEALSLTIEHFKIILPGFFPLLHIPHSRRSYAHEVTWLRTQIDRINAKSHPGNHVRPYLIHLTYWTDGIANWRSATFFNGRGSYRINENGSIGPRILEIDPQLPEHDTDDTQDETSPSVGEITSDGPVAGDHQVDARDNRLDTGTNLDSTGVFEDSEIVIESSSDGGELLYGPVGALDFDGNADQENELAGSTRRVSMRLEAAEREAGAEQSNIIEEA
ncbi:MAG: hypothetical protein Q9166_005658 [cf. Caloplaca sp. 2 TL-2023]